MARPSGLAECLRRKEPTFLLFGGKGGVGKTTMAAATALHAAEMRGGRSTLIFSSDPAPSLAESFDTPLTSAPTVIPGVPRLAALELDARAVLAEFKERYGEDILEILQKGTLLADAEAEELFSLDIPGLDEVMALKKITDFMQEGTYGLYIIDTAPTGHTLRLLTLPDLLDRWIRFLAKLRWRYRVVVGRLSRTTPPEGTADDFLLEMKRTVQRVRRLLQDADTTEFIVVTIPEALAVSQTVDLVAALREAKIPSSHLILNNVVPENTCAFCASRRRMQARHRAALTAELPAYRITDVPLQPEDVRGLPHLRDIGKHLFPA